MLTWRRVFFATILIVLFSLLRGDTIPIQDYFSYHLGGLTSRYAFDFLGWEIFNLADKLETRLVDGNYASLPTDRREQTVAAYFATADLADRLNDEITRWHADPSQASPERLAFLTEKLAAARQRLAGLEDATEAILEGQIATILAEEDIGSSPVGVFPPVLSELERPPKILIVSPRERIEIKQGAQLRPDLELSQMEALENDVDRLGVSSLVMDIGGIATYPGMVMESGSRDWVARTMVHEWFHDYLTLRPLGWSYGQNHEIIAINETVADIASQEIGDKVLERYYGVPIPTPSPPEDEVRTPEQPAAFSYNREMRTTRLTVDTLLAQGQIDQAEQYMEERRRFFLDHGYVIRKLNQAYFAFHGAYADSPTSVDPIGRDLRALRHQTPTLRQFINLTSRLTSYEELKKLIGR